MLRMSEATVVLSSTAKEIEWMGRRPVPTKWQCFFVGQWFSHLITTTTTEFSTLPNCAQFLTFTDCASMLPDYCQFRNLFTNFYQDLITTLADPLRVL